MKKRLLFLAACCFQLTAQSQVVQIEQLNTIQGADTDIIVEIAKDNSGNIFVAGVLANGTQDMDFGAGVANLSSTNGNPFVSKYDANSNLIWTKIFSSSDLATCKGIHVDDAGAVYIFGQYGNSIDADPGAGTHTLSFAGLDAYLIKLNTNGNLIWAANLNCPYGFINDVAVNGNLLYAVGEYGYYADLNPGAGTNSVTSSDLMDGFMIELDTASQFQSAVTFEGTGYQAVKTIAISSTGNIHIGGEFENTIFFVQNSNVLTMNSNGNSDVFIMNYDNSFSLTNYFSFGSDDKEGIHKIKLDNSDDVYVSGYFSDTIDFDPSGNVVEKICNGGYDAYISKFSSNGTFQWNYTYGGLSYYDNIYDFDFSGNTIYLAAECSGQVDFDPGAAVEQFSGMGTSVIVKIGTNGVYQHAMDMGSGNGGGWINPRTIFIDNNAEIHVGGMYNYTPSFVSYTNTQNAPTAAGYDGFWVRYSEVNNVGVNENHLQQLNLFPNPANDIIYLNGISNGNYFIYNSEGKLIRNSILSNSTLHISDLSPGIYVLQIQTKENLSTARFIKQ